MDTKKDHSLMIKNIFEKIPRLQKSKSSVFLYILFKMFVGLSFSCLVYSNLFSDFEVFISTKTL